MLSICYSLLVFSDDAFASVNVFIRAAHASNKVPHTFTLFSYVYNLSFLQRNCSQRGYKKGCRKVSKKYTLRGEVRETR
jgi:hypothetical protein